MNQTENLPQKPVRIFADRMLVQDDACAMLSPFWGGHEMDSSDPLHGRFDRYHEVAGSHFEMTDLERADFALLPFDFGHVLIGRRTLAEAAAFVWRMADAGKRTLVFCWNDSSEPLDLPVADTIVFRTAVDRSRRRSNEFVIPTFHEDFVEKYFGGTLPLREKTASPTVSFCGRAKPKEKLLQTLRSTARGIRDSLLRKPRSYPYGELRNRAMSVLRRHGGVECRFETFTRFFGDLGDNAHGADVLARVAARQRYVRSLEESDYVLCVRGAGNFSMRLYETLCLGRIPLIVDTDSVFPFEESLRWNELGVIVPRREIGALARRLADFHQSLTAAEFQRLQGQCRQAWLSHLSPHGFFGKLSAFLADSKRQIPS
jgi:hypothetical protein